MSFGSRKWVVGAADGACVATTDQGFFFSDTNATLYRRGSELKHRVTVDNNAT